MTRPTVERICLNVALGAAVTSFAVSSQVSLAWLLLVLPAASVFYRSRPAPPALTVGLVRLLWLVLATAGLTSLVLGAFPILAMSGGALDRVALVLGFLLAGLGGLLGLMVTARPARSTTLPAIIGVFVIAGFEDVLRLELYLLVAGVAGFVYLAVSAFAIPNEGPPRTRSRGFILGVQALLVAAAAWSVIRLLPWAQGRVEETVFELYAPPPGMGAESGSSRLGELERLKLSDRIVLRVWSARPQRLRRQVLTRFDGRNWYRPLMVAGPRPLAPTAAPDLDPEARRFLNDIPGSSYRLDEERPNARGDIRTRVLRLDDNNDFSLPGGSRWVRTPLDRLRIDAAGILLPPPNTTPRIYGVLHDRQHGVGQFGPASDAMLEASLEIPEDLDPRLIEQAKLLERGAAGRDEKIRRTIDYLRGCCDYSLEVGSFRSRQPLAEFLFEKRQGWCEYFAGSAAVLLRLQGIPTRYVRGFNLLGSQRDGEHYVVRDWDRHAWVEVYREGLGWVELDPTPAAEYESLHAGLGRSRLSRLGERLRSSLLEIYIALRYYHWSDLMSGRTLVTAILILSLVILGRWVWSRRDRGSSRSSEQEVDRTPPELAAWLSKLDARLDEIGHPRPAHRAPLEHLESLPTDELAPRSLDQARRGIELFYRARFSSRELSESELAALRHAAETPIDREEPSSR